ncbi:hypothetical protein [Mammaliicoccus lentus]|nr:hypothetical protein [Mammaliicoccus lentus]WQL55299.1 hypothetical protein P3U43_10450 [Mammaliicoccus lentus]
MQRMKKRAIFMEVVSDILFEIAGILMLIPRFFIWIGRVIAKMF